MKSEYAGWDARERGRQGEVVQGFVGVTRPPPPGPSPPGEGPLAKAEDSTEEEQSPVLKARPMRDAALHTPHPGWGAGWGLEKGWQGRRSSWPLSMVAVNGPS